MRIKFWGTRGSLPSPLDAGEFRIKAKRLLMNARNVNLNSEQAIEAYLDSQEIPNSITFGGNTPCVEITDGDNRLILDCGSGLMQCGHDMMNRGFVPGSRIDILQTHTHWDHLIGFPFFAPAYTEGTEIHIFGIHPHLEERFETQMDRVHFPITMAEMKSAIHFHQITQAETLSLGPFSITSKALHHPGGSYAYRISTDHKTVVFATDGEYTNLTEEFEEYVNFYRNADALIFDAMYATLEKTIERENYGHSTPVIGINLALTAHVKNLFLFHHDPESNDAQIIEAYNHAKKYLMSEQRHFPDNPLNLLIAYDTLTFDV